MLLIRIFNKIIFLSLYLLSFCSAALADDLTGFLSELNINKSIINKLIRDLDYINKEQERGAAAKSDDGMYYLALVPVPDAGKSGSNSPAVRLEAAAQSRALFLSRTRLALALGETKTDRKLYIYNDALASALYALYAPIGIEAKAGVIINNKLKFAAALAKISPEKAAALVSEALPQKILTGEYCRELYFNQAKQIFNAGRYAEALPLFQNLHDLKYMNIEAYLDAAECFVKTGAPKECIKLIKELRAALENNMTSDDLSRLGSLCLDAGDKDGALDAFNLARVRFREEFMQN